MFRTTSAYSLAILGLVATLSVPIAWSQQAPPIRVRGTIERVEGPIYVIKARDGAELRLTIADKPQIAALVKASLADVKQGLIGPLARRQGDRMKRREFIGLLGATVAWPLALRAQQNAKLPTIGILGVANALGWQPLIAVFVQRLSDLGWVEGRNVSIEYRWADGHSERFAELADSLVRLNVDVIVTAGGAVVPAKQATTAIPIIFAVASDPIGTGLVASLAHPGGNVTGLSVQAAELAGKRVELLRQLIPNLRRLAIIANPDYAAAAREISEVQAASRAFDLETKLFEIHEFKDISTAIEALKGSADALYVCIDPLTDTNQISIAKWTTAARIPTMPAFRDAVRAGSLMYYGPNTEDLFRRAADFVEKVLRGTKPADIPVEQPSKFDLVINISNAKALGIIVPQALLVAADEVIE